MLHSSSTAYEINCRNKKLVCDRPRIMGILNLTPDSFSDGNQYNTLDKALYHTEKMIKDGADIIDIGAESTRPYAAKVSCSEESERLFIILEKILNSFDTIISVDTYKPSIMQQALQLGAHIINDISGISVQQTLKLIAEYNAGLCIMHMQNNPHNMQDAPSYQNVVNDLIQFFADKIQLCQQHHISSQQIMLDPGFGFGKTYHDNIALLKNLATFKKFKLPILVGLSRKALIKHATGELEASKRDPASITLAILALQQGANIIRCHNVAATYQAVTMLHQIQ